MRLGRQRNRRRADAQEYRAHLWAAVRRAVAAFAKGLLAVAVAAGVVASAYFGVRWALRSPAFAIDKVSFVGLKQATQPELMKLSGLSGGENFFRVDPSAVEQAMIAHPWVRRVEVQRRFPHELIVHVQEFTAVAVASLGQLYLLDPEGRPFKRVQAADRVDLPRVTGIGREQFLRDRQGSAQRFQEAAELMAQYRQLEPSDPVSELRVEGAGLALVSQSGIEIRFGEGDRAAKFARLKRVRLELARRGLSARSIRLDNRVRPGWVAVRLASAAVDGSGAPGTED